VPAMPDNTEKKVFNVNGICFQNSYMETREYLRFFSEVAHFYKNFPIPGGICLNRVLTRGLNFLHWTLEIH
jgi:hypothetical protein